MRKILFLVLIFPFNLQAAIYRWQDSNKVIHFSDQAVENSHKVILRNSHFYESKKASDLSDVNKNVTENSSQTFYSSLTITNPQNEETINYDLGRVVVKINFSPALNSNDKLLLFLDAKPIRELKSDSDKSTTKVFHLENIERGEHQLQAKIVSSTGEVLKQSDAITFFMHQTIIKN